MSASTGTRVERPRTPARAPQRRRWHVPWAPLLAFGLVCAWWVAAPRTPDLAAQVYRVWLFEHAGFLLWDNSWYAGHHLPGYSLLFPPLASLAGTRLLGGLAVILSAWIFEALARTLYGPRTVAAALWFAVAAAGDAWIGRLTFALGVTLALAACLAFVHGRRARRGRRRAFLIGLAATSATLSAATSPVAGLLLVLAAVSWALAGAWVRWRAYGEAPGPATADARVPAVPESAGEEWGGGGPGASAARSGASWLLARLCAQRLRIVLALIAGPVVVVLAMQALFPEGGFEPYGLDSLVATLAVALAFIVALPREERMLRAAAWIFIVVNLLCEIPTPMGSNMQRYAILLAGPVLLCVLMRERPQTEGGRFRRRAQTPAGTPALNGNGGPPGGVSQLESGAAGGAGTSALPRPALAVVLAGMALWVLWGPVAQTREVLGESSTSASYYAPVERFLAGLRHPEPLRLEVPFTRAHWEAALLAPHVALARGWERQLDKRYNRALESRKLTAAGYKAWLDANGVSYVALPDAPFDESSYAEARLIRAGVPYLHEVLHTPNWRVFRVLDPSPLAVWLGSPAGRRAAPGAARMVALGHESFVLSVSAPGRYLVKLHYTPYWTVTSGAAALREAPGNLTELDVRRPGRVAVAARFTLAGAWRTFIAGL